MSYIILHYRFSMGNVRSEQGDLFLVSCFVLPWTSGGTDIPPYRMLPTSRNRCKNVCTCENVCSWKKCIQLVSMAPPPATVPMHPSASLESSRNRCKNVCCWICRCTRILFLFPLTRYLYAPGT